MESSLNKGLTFLLFCGIITIRRLGNRCILYLKLLEFKNIWSISGVVPLSHRLMAISEVSRAEQKALNLLDIDFRYLRDRSTNEWLGNYVYGEVLQEMSVFFST